MLRRNYSIDSRSAQRLDAMHSRSSEELLGDKLINHITRRENTINAVELRYHASQV